MQIKIEEIKKIKKERSLKSFSASKPKICATDAFLSALGGVLGKVNE